MRSSADSMPTDKRMSVGGTANGASAVDACVIRAGCSIRLSVGIESADDLLDDLEIALAA